MKHCFNGIIAPCYNGTFTIYQLVDLATATAAGHVQELHSAMQLSSLDVRAPAYLSDRMIIQGMGLPKNIFSFQR